MIPLLDTQHADSYPLVTRTLILLNVVGFLFELQTGAALPGLIGAYGLVPVRFWAAHGLDRWLPVFTAMFLHGGWWHLIANMWALWLFGDNVEDALGHGRFLVFYLACGAAAAVVHSAVNAASTVPSIGASGAIAGVLGAYLLFFPAARVITLIPIFVFPWFVEIPAVLYLGLWFLSQLLNGVAGLGAPGAAAGGVAWWAHVGGFSAGLVLGPLLHRPRRRAFADEYWGW